MTEEADNGTPGDDRRYRNRGDRANARSPGSWYYWIDRLGLPIVACGALYATLLRPMANDHFATTNVLRETLIVERESNSSNAKANEAQAATMSENSQTLKALQQEQSKTTAILDQLLRLQLRELPATRAAVEASRQGDVDSRAPNSPTSPQGGE